MRFMLGFPWSCLIAAMFVAGLGCVPTNVSNPPAGGGNEDYLHASETSMLHLPSYDSGGRVLAAYNDTSGWYDIQDVGGVKTRVVKPGPHSFAGLSVSRNGGVLYRR